MKIKLIVGLAAAVLAMPSFATTLCEGEGKDANVAEASKFISKSFKQKCSNNVFSAYDEDNAAAWVVSASKKGKQYYAGHTNGGAAVALEESVAKVTPGTDPTPATYLTNAAELGGS